MNFLGSNDMRIAAVACSNAPFCKSPARHTLYRADGSTPKGVPFCRECADTALRSGAFTGAPNNPVRAERRTAAPNAFPSGVSPMGGEQSGGMGNPKHEGPPPAAQAARPGRPGGRVCPECMQRVEDGYDLQEHLRSEHNVRDRMR